MSFKKSPISNRLLSLITLLCLFFSFYTEGVAQNTQTVIEGYVVAEKGGNMPCSKPFMEFLMPLKTLTPTPQYIAFQPMPTVNR